MPKEFSRMERVAELIQRKLALLIQQELKDPRLSAFITIADVVVSRDLSHAKIYVTSFDKKVDVQEAVKVLQKAAGFLRKMLGHGLKLKKIPELHFVYDVSLVEANRLTKLINDAIAKDSEPKS